MKYLRKLPDAEELKKDLYITAEQKEKREIYINNIKKILSGRDKRKILCIGPCSADNESAVLEYMLRLAKLNEKVKEAFLIVPRVYTGKPRTNGTGYKGLIHRPIAEKKQDNIFEGIVATRQMHLHIIQETGFYCADELLYPEASYYVNDLLAYTAVGARSVENQQHRLVASGLDMPVGMKNPISGDVDTMLNAIMAAQCPQNLLYHGWECETEGNPYAHAILRGYVSEGGKIHSNYHFEDICDVHDAYMMKNLKNMAVIIDCNHSNSRKHYDEQMRISKEIISLCNDYKAIDSLVKGIMIESYLIDGAQTIGEGIYGKSITDSCLGWEKTSRLVLELSEKIKQ